MRFIKFIPSEESSYLRENHPNAFLLLSLIAERARRISGKPDGLEIGEAHIGDYKKAGIETRQKYRTALEILEMRGHIKKVETCRTRKKSTTGTTTEGTKVRLLRSDTWDINPEGDNHLIHHRATTDQPPSNHEQERIRKNNKEEEEHTHGLRAVGCDVIIPINSHSNFYQPDPSRFLKPPTFDRRPTFERRREENPDEFEEELKKSYGADGTVKLTSKQYEDLLNHMSEKERDYWIDEITLDIGKKGEREFNKRYHSHYHTILSWKRIREEKKVTSPIPTTFVKKTPEENRKLAEEMDGAYESKYYTITILSQGVEITPKSGNCQPDFISYTANGFKDQFGNALMKRNFVKKR